MTDERPRGGGEAADATGTATAGVAGSVAGLRVRRGRPADLDAVVAVFEAVAEEGTWIGGEAPVDWSTGRLDAYRAQLAEDQDSSVLFLAEVGDEVAGWIGLYPQRGDVVDFAMAVLGGHRGRGLGSALLDAGLAWARDRGMPKVACTVWPHNTRAIRLYLSRGFEVEGRLRRHWRRRSGQRWDGVLMGLVLDEESPGSGLPDSPLLGDTPVAR